MGLEDRVEMIRRGYIVSYCFRDNPVNPFDCFRVSMRHDGKIIVTYGPYYHSPYDVYDSIDEVKRAIRRLIEGRRVTVEVYRPLPP